MADRTTELHTRLQRLWKGTLVVAITAGYLLILTLLLIHRDWQAALMALFLIVLAQFFRYIGDDVDRIGWQLDRPSGKPQAGEPGGQADEDARIRQRRMHRLLVALTQLPNLALVGHGYVLGGSRWAGALAIGVVAIELLHTRIRKANRAVAFQQASFGFVERGLFEGPESIARLQETKERRVEERLATLERMTEEGLISRKAYEKARDKARVRLVMEEDARKPPRPA